MAEPDSLNVTLALGSGRHASSCRFEVEPDNLDALRLSVDAWLLLVWEQLATVYPPSP